MPPASVLLAPLILSMSSLLLPAIPAPAMVETYYSNTAVLKAIDEISSQPDLASMPGFDLNLENGQAAAVGYYLARLVLHFKPLSDVSVGEDERQIAIVKSIPRMTAENWGRYTRAKRLLSKIVEQHAKGSILLTFACKKVLEDEAVRSLGLAAATTGGSAETKAVEETSTDEETADGGLSQWESTDASSDEEMSDDAGFEEDDSVDGGSGDGSPDEGESDGNTVVQEISKA